MLRLIAYVAASLSVSLFSTTYGHAEDGGLKVYAHAGLYGPEESDCLAAQDAAAVKISSFFCEHFQIQNLPEWGRQFHSLMASQFRDTLRLDLQEQLPPGVTREMMLSQTVIASLHLKRADLWYVSKRNSLDVYMPITLSLMFTNALTGEAMLVEEYSVTVQGVMLPQEFPTRAVHEFPSHFSAAISALVSSAVQRFQVNAISGVVRGQHHGRHILDIGRRNGLREGDSIGGVARVAYADADYAVIEGDGLDPLRVGQRLTRYVNQPIEYLARPSLLVVPAVIAEDLSAAYLTSRFEDVLGDVANFAVMPVNQSIALIRGPALTRAGVMSRGRRLPDYFVRLSVAALEPVETNTNISNVRRRVVEAHAFIEVINHQGRVVFATQSRDQQIDEIVEGMAPPFEQRRDAAINNALIRAAEQLSTDFRPAPLQLEVASARGSDIRISDPGGVLVGGVDLVVLRQSRRLPGISSDIWVPVGELEVISSAGGVAIARSQAVNSTRIESRDRVAYEVTGPNLQSSRIFAQCMVNDQPSISIRGSVRQPLFQAIALNGFAREFRGAVHISTFHREAARLNLSGTFRNADSMPALTPRQSDFCFEPVHQMNWLRAGPSRNGFTVNEFDLTVGYTLRQNGQRVSGGGVQATISASGIPNGSSDAVHNSSLQMDLAEETVALVRRSAASLAPPL